MATLEVTQEIAYVGMRVVRGPKWDYERQDVDNSGKQVPGTIVELATSSGGVYVDWDHKKISRLWYPANGTLALYIEEDKKIAKDPSGYTRFDKGDIVEAGDELIAMTEGSEKLYYYKEGGIVPSRIYTVKYISRGVHHNGIYINAVTCLNGEILHDYCVDIRCFAMYKKKNGPVASSPKDPYEGKYLTNSSLVTVGDNLIFRRHSNDSGDANISIGEEVQVTSVGSTRVTTNKKAYWSVDKICFTRGTPVKKVEEVKDLWEPYYLTTALGLEIGDKVIFRRHLTDSYDANLTIGHEVEVVDIDSTKCFIRTSAKANWWVVIKCFTLSRKKEKTVKELREEAAKISVELQQIPTTYYKISEESDYEMTPMGPKKKKNLQKYPGDILTKSSSISSSIKTTQDVTNRINTAGHIIKVRSSHLKIERGEGIRGHIVQSRPDKIRVAGKQTDY